MDQTYNDRNKKIIADKILARQPILNRSQKTVGYELLFRASRDSKEFDHTVNGKFATLTVINSLISVGLENVVGLNKAFINFGTELLLKDYYKLLPKETIVIEILEDVEISKDLIKTCEKAKKEGFTLALDDFFFRKGIESLIELADIIKIDLIDTPIKKAKGIIDYFKKKGKMLLAEKLETMQEFDEALRIGFDYFQGFFFSKPQLVTSKDISPYKAYLLKIMQEIQIGDIGKIIDIISSDVALSWKLLRFINSAFFGFRSPISSVKHAAFMIGENELKRWTNLIIISEIGIDKPAELLIQSTLRAKYAENIVQDMGKAELTEKAFTVGMFSLMDAILNKPLEEILKTIPLDEEIRSGILGKDTFLGNIIELIKSYENMELGKISWLVKKIGYSEDRLQTCYLDALIWTNNLFSTYYTNT